MRKTRDRRERVDWLQSADIWSGQSMLVRRTDGCVIITTDHPQYERRPDMNSLRAHRNKNKTSIGTSCIPDYKSIN